MPRRQFGESQAMSCPSGVMDGDPVSGLQDIAAVSPGGLGFPCPSQEDGKGLPVGLAVLTPGQETSFPLAPWGAGCILPALEGPPVPLLAKEEQGPGWGPDPCANLALGLS